MTLSLETAAGAFFLALLFAAPVQAITVPETPPETCARCNMPVTPLPGPTLPPKPEAPVFTPGGGEPTTPYVRQYWTGQCRYLDDGRIITHTAFGLEPFEVRQVRAHEQCRAKLKVQE